MCNWISTSDKLPPFHATLLFYAGEIDGVLCGAFYRHTHRFITANGDKFYESDITHWQPLPQPPKQ